MKTTLAFCQEVDMKLGRYMLRKHFLEVALGALLSSMPTALKRLKSNIVTFVFLLPITTFEEFQLALLLFRIERFAAVAPVSTACSHLPPKVRLPCVQFFWIFSHFVMQ